MLCPVVGAHPAGYEEAREAENEERERERIRLWYVAATRAREMLVLPRLDVAGAKNTWIELLDLALSDLPALDLSALPSASGEGEPDAANLQTREVFAAEAAAISDLQTKVGMVRAEQRRGRLGSRRAGRSAGFDCPGP